MKAPNPPGEIDLIYRRGRKSGIEVWRRIYKLRASYYVCVFDGKEHAWMKLTSYEFGKMSFDVEHGCVISKALRPRFPITS
jgi:hypothetical protein